MGLLSDATASVRVRKCIQATVGPQSVCSPHPPTPPNLRERSPATVSCVTHGHWSHRFFWRPPVPYGNHAQRCREVCTGGGTASPGGQALASTQAPGASRPARALCPREVEVRRVRGREANRIGKFLAILNQALVQPHPNTTFIVSQGCSMTARSKPALTRSTTTTGRTLPNIACRFHSVLHLDLKLGSNFLVKAIT
jgi:hypothetical protein